MDIQENDKHGTKSWQTSHSFLMNVVFYSKIADFLIGSILQPAKFYLKIKC